MSSILELINQGQLAQFHGGIHPPSRKERTQDQPIIAMHHCSAHYVPLSQHSGQTAICAVNVGDNVQQGQIIGLSDGFISANVLAPIDGVVTAIKEYAPSHPSGLPTETIIIEAHQQEPTAWPVLTLDSDDKTLIERIKKSGITGLGGASFPTSVKLSPRQNIQLLLINGAECEPYITSDDALMRSHSDQIIAGILVMSKLLSPEKVVIAIEDNKAQAIDALTSAAAQFEHIIVRAIPTLYPAGGEKQLIEVITGQQVPSGKIPADIGIVVQNVATSHAIADAVFQGKPLLSRIVTVTGDLVERPGNYRVLLGTPIIELLNFCGYQATTQQKLIVGGPMMGFALSDANAPVVKATNCIIAASNQELPDAPAEQNCIRCGDCEQVCPAQLLPQQLQWFAKDNDHDKLKQHDLFDCIECGACAYVCPSHIPLVQYYRVAKADIREATKEQQLAQRAKERFEQRTARLERDKKDREERNRIANERRKAAMKNNDDGDAIAAALARVKAKKSGTPTPQATKNEGNDRVAAAIARAKAKKAAQVPSADNSLEPSSQNSPEPSLRNSPEKSRVSQAIARAKAKKAAKLAEGTTSNAPSTSNISASNAAQQSDVSAADDKKARIAVAVAKAKAKKAAQQDTSTVEPMPQAEAVNALEGNTPTGNHPASNAAQQSDVSAADDKKARIAAAVAKAKAKKLAQQTQSKDE